MRERLFPFLVAAFVATLLMVPLVGAQGGLTGRQVGYTTVNVRQENIHDSTVIGYLTWNGGKGSIKWDPAAPSEDPGGPPKGSAADDAVLTARDAVYDWTSVNTFTPARVEFVSDPVPSDLYLNVSRLVQIVLRITGPSSSYYENACYENWDPRLDAELRIGDQIIAGGVWGQYINNWYPGVKPEPDPPGYGSCRFRVPPEVHHIPKGSVLKLTVIQVTQTKTFQYGFADDHRSFIVFPVYPEEELAFRKIGPHAASAAPSETQAGGGLQAPDGRPPTSLPVLAPMALAGLALAAPRARTRPLLLALLLLCAGLAGCLGGEAGGRPAANETGVAGTATASFRPAPDIPTGVGTILGVIRDDLGYPVAGAHVSLLGTSNSTGSDGKGKFILRGLVPGLYTLRVDREDFRSLETSVRVQPGTITSVEVTLQPLEQKSADERPHKHDYWAGRTQVEVMNRPIGHTCYYQAAGVAADCLMASSFTLPSPEGSDYNSVLPGTSEVEVKLSWNPSQLGIPRLGLMFTANNDLNYNYSQLYPRGPGQPFRIPVNWEMSDPGHQPYSSWTFHVYAAVQDQPNSWSSFATQWTPLPMPVINAAVTIRKGGVMPLEPAHPDPWGGNDTLVVLKGQAGSGTTCIVPENDYFTCYDVYYFSPQKQLPPETTWLEVELRQNRAPSPAYGWDLFYKPGNTAEYVYCNWTCDGVSGVKKAPVPTVSGLVSKYKIVLQPGEADPIYSKRSAWQFMVEADDPHAQFLDGWSHVAAAITYTVTVTAHRDPRA